MLTKFIFIIGIGMLLFSSPTVAQDSLKFLNPNIGQNERVWDLISRMTLAEKAAQMQNASPAIPRLGIPAYDWWNEALHGVARSGVATIFPQAIGMAATFDSPLIYRISTAISDEARAIYNASTAKGYHLKYSGLTFWTPNVNIFRDPRWGRGQETYGEDPFLTSKMGVAMVEGLQGNDPDYLKTAACAKHFAVHSGPEKLRHEFDAVVNMQDMHETYLPAFKSLVDAGVESIMGAYNRTNGEPCNASPYLMNDLLRKEWHFTGHYVTDCGALDDFYQGHHIVDNPVEAAALAIKFGVNLNCGSTYAHIVEAVQQGLIREQQVDSVLSGLLISRFKLGMFDPKGINPYDTITSRVINSPEHRKLAREAAQKSIVLLKNNGVLPLKNDLPKYFITGPNAASIEALIGNYYGTNTDYVTVLEGVARAIQPYSQLQYNQGILLDRSNSNPIDWATGNAKNADATIVVLGLNGLIEGEEGAAIASEHFGDRLTYELPPNQIEFLRKLKVGHSHPVIAVIMAGSPIDMTEIHELADAVVWAWYPGEEGGNAIADILFGNVSPSGRLPITFPKSLSQLPAYDDYSMKGRTYRYMTKEPMYPFGFGLSYTQFTYSNLKLNQKIIQGKTPLEIEVTLTNNGSMESDEIAQLYISFNDETLQKPLFSLKGFQRIHLKPGLSQIVKFSVDPSQFELANEQGQFVLNQGQYQIYVGGSLPTNRSKDLGCAQSVQGQVKVTK